MTNDLVADTLYVLGSVYEKDLANVAKRELLEWARDSYGAPVTYTNANGANKFVLYVDGGGQYLVIISIVLGCSLLIKFANVIEIFTPFEALGHRSFVSYIDVCSLNKNMPIQVISCS